MGKESFLTRGEQICYNISSFKCNEFCLSSSVHIKLQQLMSNQNLLSLITYNLVYGQCDQYDLVPVISWG
jgi:hypothetical protein